MCSCSRGSLKGSAPGSEYSASDHVYSGHIYESNEFYDGVRERTKPSRGKTHVPVSKILGFVFDAQSRCGLRYGRRPKSWSPSCLIIVRRPNISHVLGMTDPFQPLYQTEPLTRTIERCSRYEISQLHRSGDCTMLLESNICQLGDRKKLTIVIALAALGRTSGIARRSGSEQFLAPPRQHIRPGGLARP